jgi:glycolate oxidase FAD binding subunit
MDVELLKLRERVLVAGSQRTPLQLHGARTKDFYGEGLAGEPLDLSAHRGIIDYEPSELVMTARCGTPLSEIETALTERHHRHRTVGSAANASRRRARFRTRRQPSGG